MFEAAARHVRTFGMSIGALRPRTLVLAGPANCRYIRAMQGNRSRLEAEAQRGIAALQRGDFVSARSALEPVARSGSASAQLWLLLGQACVELKDAKLGHEALDQVLAADQHNPFALLLKGDLYLGGGDDRAAGSYYRTGISSAEATGSFPADLRQRVDRARTALSAIEQRFRDHMQRELARAGIAQPPPRMAEAIDIASGAQPIYLQQPTSFYYPGLPQRVWYEAEDFPWIRELEEAASEIRAEVEAVLADETGLVPYVERPKDRASRGHSLLDDSRWSAFHLWKDGAPVEENARRCPKTMALLERAPIPRIRGRSPMALISILKPGTHIQPHHGMLNTRLICHIPLVVPPGCQLRVGRETRDVVEGRAMLFDDSIEHEAWNNGDAVRAVLLFEIWRPELSEDERAALTAMFETIVSYPSAGN
jgi:tetratricopeptide (TPR) repeat protein